MKFDRRVVVPFGRDGDLLKLVKVNDEFAFIYIGGKDGPSRAALEVQHQEISLCATMEGHERVGCSNHNVTDVVGSGDGHSRGGSGSNGR